MKRKPVAPVFKPNVMNQVALLPPRFPARPSRGGVRVAPPWGMPPLAETASCRHRLCRAPLAEAASSRHREASSWDEAPKGAEGVAKGVF